MIVLHQADALTMTPRCFEHVVEIGRCVDETPHAVAYAHLKGSAGRRYGVKDGVAPSHIVSSRCLAQT